MASMEPRSDGSHLMTRRAVAIASRLGLRGRGTSLGLTRRRRRGLAIGPALFALRVESIFAPYLWRYRCF
jgi:hypothetical protein